MGGDKPLAGAATGPVECRFCSAIVPDLARFCPKCGRPAKVEGSAAEVRAPHDVFISYSHKDKPVAYAVCSKLEHKGIRCWVAPRDIMPGADWGEAIVDAIERSRILLLIYTHNVNDSPQIKREVERAVSKGLMVMPVRLEDAPVSRSLQYYISTTHWLDAMTPPLEKHLNHIADTLAILLKRLKDAGVNELDPALAAGLVKPDGAAGRAANATAVADVSKAGAKEGKGPVPGPSRNDAGPGSRVAPPPTKFSLLAILSVLLAVAGWGLFVAGEGWGPLVAEPLAFLAGFLGLIITRKRRFHRTGLRGRAYQGRPWALAGLAAAALSLFAVFNLWFAAHDVAYDFIRQCNADNYPAARQYCLADPPPRLREWNCERLSDDDLGPCRGFVSLPRSLRFSGGRLVIEVSGRARFNRKNRPVYGTLVQQDGSFKISSFQVY